MVKDPSANTGDKSSIPGSEDPLVKELTTHSSIFFFFFFYVFKVFIYKVSTSSSGAGGPRPFLLSQKYGTLHEFACHPCTEAMLIFSV